MHHINTNRAQISAVITLNKTFLYLCRCLTAAWRGNHVTHEHVFLTGPEHTQDQQRGLVYDPG